MPLQDGSLHGSYQKQQTTCRREEDVDWAGLGFRRVSQDFHPLLKPNCLHEAFQKLPLRA